MYICRIKACGLIARPTTAPLGLCAARAALTHMLHPAGAAPAVIQTFYTIRLPLHLLLLFYFRQIR